MKFSLYDLLMYIYCSFEFDLWALKDSEKDIISENDNYQINN